MKQAVRIKIIKPIILDKKAGRRKTRVTLSEEEKVIVGLKNRNYHLAKLVISNWQNFTF